MSNLIQIPQYDTRKFTQIWDSYDSFIEDYESLPAGMQVMKKVTSEGVDSYPTLETLFYLLYAAHGNDPIANYVDENQWKFDLFSIVYQYGPTWERKLEIQNTLRALSDADIFQGSKAIYNTATNPGEAPNTSTLEELSYINGQNTTNYKKAKMEGYTELYGILRDDLTKAFLDKFRRLFKKFVQPQRQFIYVSED